MGVKLCHSCRLRVFENRVLRRIFGPKREEVTGDWRKVHNEELNDLYSLPNIIRVKKLRRTRRARLVALWGLEEVHTRFLVGKPEGKRPYQRSQHTGKDNIMMDLQEVGWGVWIGLIWVRIGTGGRR